MQRDSYFKAFDNTLSIKVRIAFTLSLCVDEYFMREASCVLTRFDENRICEPYAQRA